MQNNDDDLQINENLASLEINSSEDEEIGGETHNDIELYDEDDIKAKQAHEQRQAALDHIEKTYGLTTIPDSNIDILPADDELTSDIPLDTDYIYLVHLKISSLENLKLERFKNLESINLRDNLITSLNSLKKLTEDCKIRMEELDFYDNRIKHISSHISEFENLKILDLSFNNIKHIKHLEPLTKLENLYFVQNKINKIENLESLVNLQNLELGGNKIENIENLDTLINLNQLWLGQNKISNLQGLSMLQNLRILSIQSNKIEKIQGLDGLVNLQELYLSHNKIKKIEGLENLSNLQVLDVTSNQISLIENLDNLTQLTDFWCSYNLISDFENIRVGMKTCDKIETVYFEGNPIQLKEPTMYRTKLKLCFTGKNLEKIDALYLN